MMSLIDFCRNEPRVKQVSKFCDFAGMLDIERLQNSYQKLIRDAPRRGAKPDGSYFVNRTGIAGTGRPSNRKEEHLAVALFNASKGGLMFSVPSFGTLEIVDYQTPLKARQSDQRVGKVDLFGIANQSTMCVIELKVSGKGSALGDTPLQALLQALAYSAIVESNAREIAAEISAKWDYQVAVGPPTLVVMAPEDYWRDYLNHPKTDDWKPVLDRLRTEIHQQLGVPSWFLALRDWDFEMGSDGKPPRMRGSPMLFDLSDLI